MAINPKGNPTQSRKQNTDCTIDRHIVRSDNRHVYVDIYVHIHIHNPTQPPIHPQHSPHSIFQTSPTGPPGREALKYQKQYIYLISQCIASSFCTGCLNIQYDDPSIVLNITPNTKKRVASNQKGEPTQSQKWNTDRTLDGQIARLNYRHACIEIQCTHTRPQSNTTTHPSTIQPPLHPQDLVDPPPPGREPLTARLNIQHT